MDNNRITVIYLLTRKSDNKKYIGITYKDRYDTRMKEHRQSERYANDDFTDEILEEGEERWVMKYREEAYIRHYDTFENGLNGNSKLREPQYIKDLKAKGWLDEDCPIYL